MASIISLPLPYKTNCTNFWKLPWQLGKPRRLSPKMCTVGCSQYLQMQRCNMNTKNLSLFYEELPWEPKAVNQAQRKCAEEEEENSKVYCRSVCGVPCKDIHFEVTETENTLSQADIGHLEKVDWEDMTWEEKSKNLVFLRVYFSTLEHKIYQHTPKYDTLELFSYMGGYSGVWLGFSLLTVYELIEILFSTLVFAMRKARRFLQHRRISRAITDSKTYPKNVKSYKKKFYR